MRTLALGTLTIIAIAAQACLAGNVSKTLGSVRKIVVPGFRTSLSPRYRIDYLQAPGSKAEGLPEVLLQRPDIKAAPDNPNADAFILTAYNFTPFVDGRSQRYVEPQFFTPESVQASVQEYSDLKRCPARNWYRVNVDLSSQVEAPPALLRDGEDAATSIFRGIHVQLTWTGQKQQTSKAVAGCVGELATPDLGVEIVPNAPAGLSTVALAMAMPYADSGVRIVIFHDRLEPLLGGHHAPAATILGYVLAHEIAHVLQGVARHSETGIMRARWTDNDFKLMGERLLTFTAEDVQLIRHHLALCGASAGRSANRCWSR